MALTLRQSKVRDTYEAWTFEHPELGTIVRITAFGHAALQPPAQIAEFVALQEEVRAEEGPGHDGENDTWVRIAHTMRDWATEQGLV